MGDIGDDRLGLNAPTSAFDRSARRRPQVAIVNDYDLIVRGLRTTLAASRELLDIVELAADDDRRSVELALFDTFGFPGLGLERIAALAADQRVGAVAVYTWEMSDEQLRAFMAHGARAVLAKSISALELTQALIAVSRGEVVVSREFGRRRAATWPGSSLGLTSRESEIISFLATGKSNLEIARACNVSENTVKTHLKSIFQKLNVTSRTQAMARIHRDPSFGQRTTLDGTESHE
jgi:two-component system, NarL family, response regulator LiaR